MAKDVSVLFKASDNLTKSIRDMQGSVKGLSRDISEYRKVQDDAFKKKVEVKFDIEQAKGELKELTKAIRQNVDGAEQAFKDKQLSLERMTEEYRRLVQVTREASKAENDLVADISRTSNANATRNKGMMGDTFSRSDMLADISKAGLGGMLGNALAGGLQQAISSTYGETTGGMIGSILGSTASGAAMGSIAGPMGAMVGGAVGGIAGSIQATAAVQEKKDDFFRSEITDMYSMIKSEREAEFSLGIDIASRRESNIKALSTLLGSDEAGRAMFEDIKTYGIATPYEADQILDSAKQMLAYGIKESNIMSDVKMLGDVAMGDQNKLNSLAYAYAQTQSAGKLTGQDNLQYIAAGFNPLTVLGEERGKSLAEMEKMMSKGLISAKDVTHAFELATSEGWRFHDAATKQMDAYAGKVSMLQDIKNEIAAGYGAGFIEEKKLGLDKDIEDYTGKLGEDLRRANELIGAYHADLDNKHQQAIIDAQKDVMGSEEYIRALKVDDRAKMGQLLEEAQMKAELEYRNSEGYKLQQQADISLVQSLQQDALINSEYMQYGMLMAEQFSLGFSGAVREAQQVRSISLREKLGMSEGTVSTSEGVKSFFMNPGKPSELGLSLNVKNGKLGSATGLDRVPVDGLYLLHEGEKVSTRVDSDKRDITAAPIINIVVNNHSGNPYEITQEVCRQLIEASENYGKIG